MDSQNNNFNKRDLANYNLYTSGTPDGSALVKTQSTKANKQP